MDEVCLAYSSWKNKIIKETIEAGAKVVPREMMGSDTLVSLVKKGIQSANKDERVPP